MSFDQKFNFLSIDICKKKRKEAICGCCTNLTLTDCRRGLTLDTLNPRKDTNKYKSPAFITVRPHS